MDLLVGEIFRNAARAVPDRVAAALDREVLTFGQIETRSTATAHALRARGIGRGDRVAAWVPTNLALVPLFAGLAKAGAVFVPLNPALSGPEVDPSLILLRPALIVTDAHHLDDARATGVEACVLEDLGDETAGGEVEDVGLAETDPHVVFLTSGSTGAPKGVILSHRVNVLRSHPSALLEPRGAIACPYPMFHMAAWTIALQQWQARDRVVFLRAADAHTICRAVEEHAAARLNCIPALWRRILDHLPGCAHDLSSLRFADTGTSATPPELLDAIAGALPGAHIRVFYGSTEAGGVAALDHDDLRWKPGSVGTPAPWAEVRVDQTGELRVRSPLLFDGYFDDPGATKDALADGWYRTGDLAEIDADGYITIVGRAGDLIRTGGEAVAPADVEAVLATHPSIEDVAVIGVPDERWGEIVCAVVVPAEGADPPDVEVLRAHCAGRLVAFKHPRRVVVVDAVPRTAATGQIQRKLLVERLAP